MGIEIRMLVWSVILGLVQIAAAAVAGMGQRGLGCQLTRPGTCSAHRGGRPAGPGARQFP
jgi:hypothetical protein